MKTKEQRLEQVKRIMKKLLKRGQNCEKINDLYRELIKPKVRINPTTFQIVLNEKWIANGDKAEIRYVGGCDPYTEDSKGSIGIDELGVWHTNEGSFNPWFKFPSDTEGLHFAIIHRDSIPFDFTTLQDGDVIENRDGDLLICRKEEGGYQLVTCDSKAFLNKNKIYQIWIKI